MVWECPAVTSIEAAKNREVAFFNWGRRNYNSGDTSVKSSVLGKRKNQGLIKANVTRLLKMLAGIMIGSDPRKEMVVPKGQAVTNILRV